MTRPLDSLGRIVIPKEMRETMGYCVGDPVEIFIDVEARILTFRKYTGLDGYLDGSAAGTGTDCPVVLRRCHSARPNTAPRYVGSCLS